MEQRETGWQTDIVFCTESDRAWTRTGVLMVGSVEEKCDYVA